MMSYGIPHEGLACCDPTPFCKNFIYHNINSILLPITKPYQVRLCISWFLNLVAGGKLTRTRTMPSFIHDKRDPEEEFELLELLGEGYVY